MKCSMYLLLFLFVLSFSAIGQQSSPATPVPETHANVDTKLHENVVKLTELMGTRQHLLDNLDKMTQAGKEKVQQDHPTWDPAFGEEWAKRMRAQTKVEDYVEVVIQAYEKHFSNAEIEEMIQIQRDLNVSKTPNISPALKEKLAAMLVTIQSEILGGCTQIGAKLGGDIGQAIAAEHPEWVKEPNPAPKHI